MIAKTKARHAARAAGALAKWKLRTPGGMNDAARPELDP